LRILFDQGTPAPLRQALSQHEVVTAFEQGWQALQNGELLAAAEAAGFELIVTTDQNLRNQQNLAGRQLAILVLSTTDWRRIRLHTDQVVLAVESMKPGTYVGLAIPHA
jgi:predicted nuclease of predicted toxin-antitoxin system